MYTVMRRAADQARRDEGGMTLIELVVAMVIMMLVMSSMLGVFISMLTTVTKAKQRQAGTALATQVMEQIRALPYDAVRSGLLSTDLTGDPAVVSASSTFRFRPAASPGIDEVLVTTGSQAQAPLFPHLRTIAVENVDYRVGTYVTQASTAQPAYNLTVIVSWSSTATGDKLMQVMQRSTSYSPSGCLSTAQHPFSGPCQASFAAQAGQTLAGVTVTNVDDSAQPIPGFDGSKVELSLPLIGSGVLIEQTTSAKAATATSGAAATGANSSSASGAQAASAVADSDPSSPSTGTESATTPVQTSSPVELSGSAGTLSAQPTAADSGRGDAQSASGTGCGAADSFGTTIATGQPCASTWVQPTGGTPGSITLDLADAVGEPVPLLTVATVAAAPSPARAAAARLVSPSTAACPTTSGLGCAHAASLRELGTVTTGGLPAGVGPAGFTSAVEVVSLVEEARAESGTGARAPLHTRAGSVRVWNGSAYSEIDLASVAGPTTYSAADATAALMTSDGKALVVHVETEVTVSPAGTSSSGALPCDAEACTAQAGGGSAVKASAIYTVTLDGTQLTRFVVVADLGSLLAQASFQAAPDA